MVFLHCYTEQNILDIHVSLYEMQIFYILRGYKVIFFT